MVYLFLAVPSNQYRSRPVLKEHLANDVHRQLNCISVDWFDIGRELGVEFNYREELKRDPELTNPSRLEYVLHKWSQSECSDVNWDTIIEVLEKLQQRKVLKAVKHYLLNDLEAVRKYSWTEI